MKKTFSELSRVQRSTIFVLGTVQVALQIGVLADLIRKDASEVNGPKAAWAAASFINFIGPIAYIVKGKKK